MTDAFLQDSLVKLWELSTSRCLIAYTGAGTTGKQENQAQAVFNHSEDFVMFPDEATTSLCCWDSRNASRKQVCDNRFWTLDEMSKFFPSKVISILSC